jgi:hypothetical protein
MANPRDAQDDQGIDQDSSDQNGDRVVPIPASSTQSEHDRVRSSNDRDQELEREGELSEHNRGYDEAADGAVRPAPIDNDSDT